MQQPDYRPFLTPTSSSVVRQGAVVQGWEGVGWGGGGGGVGSFTVGGWGWGEVQVLIALIHHL